MEMNMNMGSTTTGGMASHLHFTPGDSLYLSAWTPTSPGAIVGACIGLFLLAVFERWFAALRAVSERHWKRRALLLSSRYSKGSPPRRPNSLSEDSLGTQKTGELASVEDDNSIPPLIPSRPRTIPPFIASQDILRGIMFSFQAFLGYLLMLAIMTMQAGYLISIIIGLGIGEVLFGRLASGFVH